MLTILPIYLQMAPLVDELVQMVNFYVNAIACANSTCYPPMVPLGEPRTHPFNCYFWPEVDFHMAEF